MPHQTIPEAQAWSDVPGMGSTHRTSDELLPAHSRTTLGRLTYAGVVPSTLRLILGSLLVLVGAALLVVAALGARLRLRRNRWAGVRTAATLRSEHSFAVANEVAAVLMGAAGLVGTVGGAVLIVGGGTAADWIVLVVSAAGLLVLAGIGGVAGERAAAALMPAASACAGTCLGCDIVSSCRKRVPAEQAAVPDERA